MTRILIDAVTGKIICGNNGKVITVSEPLIPEKALETRDGKILETKDGNYFATK